LVAAANPTLSAAQVVSVTQLTAQDDVSGNGRDNQLGNGIVRADRAVAASLSMVSVGLPATSKLRLRKFNAAPEPVRRGQVASFTVRVQAKFPDGRWRANPLPTLVRFEFRAKGTKRFRVVAEVASGPDGSAVMLATPRKAGMWRAKVRQATGKWTASKGDYLKVRR
jgi:hypothetical protein